MLFTVTELHEKLCSITGSLHTYSVKWLKKRLQEQYKKHIFSTDISGKRNTVWLKDVANEIMNDEWYADRSANLANERTRIVTAAAKLHIWCQVLSKNKRFKIWSGHLVTFFELLLKLDSLNKHQLVSVCWKQWDPIVLYLLYYLDLKSRLIMLGYSISYDEV